MFIIKYKIQCRNHDFFQHFIDFYSLVGKSVILPFSPSKGFFQSIKKSFLSIKMLFSLSKKWKLSSMCCLSKWIFSRSFCYLVSQSGILLLVILFEPKKNHSSSYSRTTREVGIPNLRWNSAEFWYLEYLHYSTKFTNRNKMTNQILFTIRFLWFGWISCSCIYTK